MNRATCPWYATDADGALKAGLSPSVIKTTTKDTNKVKGGGILAISASNILDHLCHGLTVMK